MKLCVIGNSHLAAIKNGWDEIKAEYPDVELVFFGAVSPDLANLKVQGRRLVPMTENLRVMMAQTSGGLETVERFYDGYVVVGCRLSFKRLTGVAAGGRALENAVERALAIKLAVRLRKIVRVPIAVLPVPFGSADHEVSAEMWKDSDEDLAAAVSQYQKILQDVGKECGFVPIPQPAETIVRACFTKPEFALGGQMLTAEKSADKADGYHMNGKFGAIYLREVIDSFAKAAAA
jgi:hypothetical protein